MNRLWVRLTLGFALVILVTVGAIALLADLTAGNAFRRYLSYSDSSAYQTLVSGLAEYYRAHGSWQGIDSLLDQIALVPGPGPWQRIRERPGTSGVREGRFQIVLADANQRVVYDSYQDRSGGRLTRDEKAAAQDIELDGEVIGKLVIAWPSQEAVFGPLEHAFVSRLRWLLLGGALLAAGLGVLLGLTLSRGLTAPLQRLATAARAVARRDFSRRVAAEGSVEMAEVAQAFNEMAAALEISEQQRQNMIADVAHELRSPLSVVQGNLRAILDDVYSLDKAEISRLYDETRLLSRLVDDLQELALADAGQLRLNLQAIDAGQVVQATVENLTLAAEAQEVALTVQLPDQLPAAGSEWRLPAVQADPDRLAQVLRNLLVNALRHTQAGGSVTVGASLCDDAVQIAVGDTGIGIAPEDLPHVFDRFWRADRARRRGDRWSGGSGLGLSVAKSLVEAQGGRIWAESQPDQGSTFYFTLPLA